MKTFFRGKRLFIYCWVDWADFGLFFTKFKKGRVSLALASNT